jgi:hypothetical protein
VSCRVVLVLNLNVRKKRKKMEYKKRLTPVLLHSISSKEVQSCAKTRTAIYIIGIVTAVPLEKVALIEKEFNLIYEREASAKLCLEKIKLNGRQK